MNKELKNLTNKVVKLHECAKLGKNKTSYKLFKESMAALLQLEGNGLKSATTQKIKAILAEYYNKYQATVKKDPTRVIIESNKNAAEKAQERAEKEIRKQLKTYHKELMANVSHLKEAILEGDWARIEFHAGQTKKIAEKVEGMARVENQEDYIE